MAHRYVYCRFLLERDNVSSRPTSGMMSGALRLPLNGNTQQINETDFYYSGIYVEDSGPTTTL